MHTYAMELLVLATCTPSSFRLLSGREEVTRFGYNVF